MIKSTLRFIILATVFLACSLPAQEMATVGWLGDGTGVFRNADPPNQQEATRKLVKEWWAWKRQWMQLDMQMRDVFRSGLMKV